MPVKSTKRATRKRRQTLYPVRFYKGEYIERQQQANADGAVAYIEHHFNSSASPQANYAVVITGANASQTSKNWGPWYAHAVAQAFHIPIGGDQGLVVGGYNGRGDHNLRFTDMPAILLEPLFCSNPQHAEWIRSDAGQGRLAAILCEGIQRFFQKGGLIGFSVGHKYKPAPSKDRGASIHGGGWEADYAEMILNKARGLLEKVTVSQQEREIRVLLGDKILFKQAVDADAEVQWDPARGMLRIESA